MLNHLRMTPSQLHPIARAFMKVFQHWCEYQGGVLSLKLFYNLFNITCTSTRAARGQGLLSLPQPKKVFDIYIDNCKNLKDHYFLVVPCCQDPIPVFVFFHKISLPFLAPLLWSHPNMGIDSKKVGL